MKFMQKMLSNMWSTNRQKMDKELVKLIKKGWYINNRNNMFRFDLRGISEIDK